MNTSLDISLEKNNPEIRFWHRFVSNFLWRLVINTLLILFIVKDSPSEYAWIAILFFVILFAFESYFSWKNEKYLLMLLKVDAESNSIHVVVNKFDEVYLDKTYPISSLSGELRELRFGRLFVPNYMLVLKNEGKVVLKQRGNAVWKRTKIKELAKQLIAIISRSSTFVSKENNFTKN